MTKPDKWRARSLILVCDAAGLISLFLFSEHDESSSRQGEDPQSVRQREEVGPDLRPGESEL